MKVFSQILLFVFMTFLFTPTIVSVIEKDIDISIFYSLSEEEKSHKEFKAIFNLDFSNAVCNTLQLNSGAILSENLSQHDKISSTIFIPPPEQV